MEPLCGKVRMRLKTLFHTEVAPLGSFPVFNKISFSLMCHFITSQINNILKNHANHSFTYLRMCKADVFVSVLRTSIYFGTDEFNLPYLYCRKNSKLIEIHDDFCRVKLSELHPPSRSDCSY